MTCFSMYPLLLCRCKKIGKYFLRLLPVRDDDEENQQGAQAGQDTAQTECPGKNYKKI